MKKNDRNVPVCKHCGQSGAGVQFPLFPRTPGETFGAICVPCDDTQIETINNIHRLIK